METLPRLALAEMPKIPRFSPDASRPVELLAFPAVQLLDVAGPLQVFATANDLSGGRAPYAPPRLGAFIGF